MVDILIYHLVIILSIKSLAQSGNERLERGERIILFNQLDKAAAHNNTVSYHGYPSCLLRIGNAKTNTDRLLCFPLYPLDKALQFRR